MPCSAPLRTPIMAACTRSAPARGHIVREHGRGPLIRLQLRHRARQPKVRQLHRALAVQQQVARLRARIQRSQVGASLDRAPPKRQLALCGSDVSARAATDSEG